LAGLSFKDKPEYCHLLFDSIAVKERAEVSLFTICYNSR
jgi:hypothetical protein